MSQVFKQEWLSAIVDIATEAGDAIMAIYGEDDLGVVTKADDSPVTAADLASHRVIVERLQQLTPNIPVMSEESTGIDWQQRRHWQAYWLIDPLDGTKEFIKRNGEFTVNIAFIEQDRAVAGVVYAPVLDKCFYGEIESGAWLKYAGAQRRLTKIKDLKTAPPRIVGSRSHLSPGLQTYLEQIGEHEMKSVGSSLKFCLLAEGEADIYPRLGLTSEWDTAAAQAVLESAGGRVLQYDTNTPLNYNQKADILNPYFIAYAPHWD
ncbi:MULTISPECIES: 3'(2'),5'-bisphosphate nucleotidase CysQ [unclassified Shewanella]|uniref:3'(2'),5'-bisphosphate nucleotidase CysQ n=1 Tax=unclassified Shewanella TaxID=196818 RepID=UPI001BBBADD6|nr:MULTISPECIES: 3'(2'),5'-bisphosphate nucleotidase CysQ [unclassified Shewanella]GIU18188.1 3'(2'),5'-bisphosphate nucleotidase CysQ [Shewanella sp. MBTL60-112-B1]GIU38990.1 3'(2'),5'-bisphosphate nucleotidase CysQ [Shewanella sp. MBTL60-112-B2]